ncbi:hypothetical protein ONS95_001611 [Cadophora gregata]|uniref:uncharacterized protein n=2 Tax=Cadophora gregata TaxID=51156 RepID=UPI0026DCF2D1|nr:uncharacterized protein ONS95_001611 [Cadophora gregata]KAK0111238.1 hypothetical protein ONS95_001611 [Cadophora gregata]
MMPVKAYSRRWRADYQSFSRLKHELQRQLDIIEPPGSDFHRRLGGLAVQLEGFDTFWNSHRHFGFERALASYDRPGVFDSLDLELMWKLPAFCKPSSQYIDVKPCHEMNTGADTPVAYNGDFWDSDALVEWASSSESSILLVEGDYQCDYEIDEISRDLIPYLEDHDEPVVWIPNDMSIVSSMSHGTHILKQLAVQILQKGILLYDVAFLSYLVEMFLLSPGGSRIPQDANIYWFDVLRYVLRGIPNLCMVIDLRVLEDHQELPFSWVDQFSNLFERLRCEDSTILKVVLLTTWPLPKGNTDARTIIINSESGPPKLQRVHRIHWLTQRNGTRSLSFATKRPFSTASKFVHQSSNSYTSQVSIAYDDSSSEGERKIGSVSAAKGAASKGPADWFTQMKSFEKTVDASRKEPDAAHPRVKITVLDTGLDLSHREMIRANDEGRLRTRDFVEDTDNVKDSDGHGTHCTSLALRYAPNAEIFAGRVFRKNEADTDSFSILTKAIRYAAEVWKVDIISLSLGFTDEDDRHLREEIRKASANNILIFASAANKTSNETKPIRFPARMNDVICIFSSNSYSRPSDFNPRAHYFRPNLTFPGEDIKSAWPSALANERTFEWKGATYKKHSGSSCSTPIAAAVAAGILEFLWQERVPAVRRPELLKHYTGMTRIFMRFMVDDFKYGDNSYNYVKPWMLISEHFPKLEIPGLISHALDKIDG